MLRSKLFAMPNTTWMMKGMMYAMVMVMMARRMTTMRWWTDVGQICGNNSEPKAFCDCSNCTWSRPLIVAYEPWPSVVGRTPNNSQPIQN